MEEVKAGDIAVLQSGSDPMTVLKTYTANGISIADVAWSTSKGDHHTASYPTAGLKKIG